MDFIRPDQILTIVLFLGLLALAWVFVRVNRQGLGAKVRAGKRITVQEVTAISPQDRAMIMRVDDREFFVIKSKGVAPVLTEITKPEDAA
ncbi:hypothetical protein BVC71_01300 [Marivivens niveibacter]|uniref:Flagellar assembly protein FliO n=1 Tax=Marivivens niveibacter TaxID=1930667 RepID=A0A251X0U8_9RHOB|nr:hypothetical protein [Marivivens niveibacter]OUD10181.1 hypothetical protein BVC71_01300 [Marivivens niveibacter]